jgi:carboxymethylenebutenolidase
MRTKLLIAVMISFLTSVTSFGGTNKSASPQSAQTVSFKSGSDTATGYLALPGGEGRHPGIVVIHEWWGLNDWVKEQAQRLAGRC